MTTETDNKADKMERAVRWTALSCVAAALIFTGAWAPMAIAQTKDAGGAEAPPPRPFIELPESAVQPFGAVALSPTRVVLSSSKRSGAVELFNTGTADLIVDIDLVDFEVTEAGEYKKVEAGATATSAKKLIRYSPRRVRLRPQEAQSVRILARFRRSTPAGEYRSHMQFIGSAPLKVGAAADVENSENAPPDGQLSVSVGVRYGITIPIIIRNGALSASATLSNIRRGQNAEGEAVLEGDLGRQGDRSIAGDLIAINADTGDQIGLLRNYSVYFPLELRQFTLAISETPKNILLRYFEGGSDAANSMVETRVH